MDIFIETHPQKETAETRTLEMLFVLYFVSVVIPLPRSASPTIKLFGLFPYKMYMGFFGSQPKREVPSFLWL